MSGFHGFVAVYERRAGRNARFLQPPDQLTGMPLHLLPFLFGMRGTAIKLPVPGELPEVRIEAGSENHQVGARQLHAVRPAQLHAEKLVTTSAVGFP